MKTNNKILHDNSELIAYCNDMPFSCRTLSSDNRTTTSPPIHWHYDFQYLYVLSGTLNYYINGKIVSVEKDNGIFINSFRLHNYIPNKNQTTVIILQFHPDIFGKSSNSINEYINLKTANDCVDYIILNTNISWQNTILKNIREINTEVNQYQANLIRIIGRIYWIFSEICDHIESCNITKVENNMKISFLKMIDFIHDNYNNKLLLADIANSGNVCKSTCSQLFQKFISQSPISYLTDFRLKQSINFLLNTELSVTNIALLCGFQSSSYYINLFKRKIGETPVNYRKSRKQPSIC